MPPLGGGFRFQVQVTAACPELLHDLQTIPSRSRPERLRALAMIGITVLRGGIGAVGPPVQAPHPELPADERLQQQRLRLLSAIGGDAD
jgi:hypothetical protein